MREANTALNLSHKSYMKASLLLVLISLAIGIFSCQKEDPTPEYPIDAIVLGVNSDCGIYAIKILNGLKKVKTIVGPTVGDSIYIARNLPESLEIEGTIISLDVRAPKADELGVCRAMGPSYSWLFVERAVEKKNR